MGAPEVELKDAEVKVAHQLIEALAAEWDPEKYHDTFQENVKKLIETKLEGGKITEVEKPKKLAPVVDLMAALKQSLAEMEGKKKPAAPAREAVRKAVAEGKRKAAFSFQLLAFSLQLRQLIELWTVAPAFIRNSPSILEGSLSPASEHQTPKA